MPITKHGKPFVKKTITVRQDQSEFIEKSTLNLSKFVQQKLDEKIKKGI
ncbi:MAG: hypothetical protein V1776_00010 [Candidatus Diapherotrites archaeon]